MSCLDLDDKYKLADAAVHEKSILLPMLPASLLLLEDHLLYKGVFLCAMFSMFPLLRRDGLVIPYFALFVLYLLMFEVTSPAKTVSTTKEMNLKFPLSLLNKGLLIIGSVLVLGYLILHPPARYPFLFEALISALVFIFLIILAIYSNLKQWSSSFSNRDLVGKKKLH